MSESAVTSAWSPVALTLESRFGSLLSEMVVFRDELTYRVPPERWAEILAFCRDYPDLDFDRLDCLVADHLPERVESPLEVIAHLTSTRFKRRVRLKTGLAEGEELDSVTRLWPSAGFDEREAFEMFGITFKGHPDLRRLLTTPDFEGHPLRKDFPLRGRVGGRVRTTLRGKI